MTFRGRGSAKLLLFGEHAAVYGYPAVGIGLSDSTTVEVTPMESRVWSAPGLPVAYHRWFDSLSDALDRELHQLFPHRPVEMIRGRVTIHSDIPVARGFGSSATLCVALAQAALGALAAGRSGAMSGTTGGDFDFDSNNPDTPDQTATIWLLANRLERVFHGTPSGIDTGLAVRRGITAFYFEGAELPRARTIQTGHFTLVTGAVPRSSGTRELVSIVRQRMDAGDRRTAELLSGLGGLARAAIELIPTTTDHANVTRLADLADRAHHHLEELGLGHPQISRYLDIGRSAGAKGGKLSGAGGGGAFYLICDSTRTAGDVARELSAAGVDPETLRTVTVT